MEQQDNGIAWLFRIGDQYYLTHDFGDDYCNFKKDAVPLDELIAEPVKNLCNKGYITNYSCSGHPYNTCAYEWFEDRIESIDPRKYIAVITDRGIADIEIQIACSLESGIDDYAYISFVRDYSFPNLPTDWYYDKHALRTHITANSVVEYFKVALSRIEALTRWIDKLPAIKPDK